MTYDEFCSAATLRHLAVLGGFHPTREDALPESCATLVLLGPKEPGFWAHFTESDEYRDGAPDPMDRWSTRVISDWAGTLNAEALFPFGGPPYNPFFTWALQSGRCHASPIRLLLHDSAGLFVSFRGALALPWRLALPDPPPNPCETCASQPCRTACPVGAFDGNGYDVPGCQTFLAGDAGNDCLGQGCAARRACPVSQSHGRLAQQSAFHMKAFLSSWPID